MGIMTRLLRLCRADVHGVMDQLEDKKLLFKQHLREMETGLDYKEQQISVLAQHIGRLISRVTRHTEEMGNLEKDLTLALEKNKDDIARALIRKRRALATASSHLKERVEAATNEKTQLSDTLVHQRRQYETLKAKVDVYCYQATDNLIETVSHHTPETMFALNPSNEEIELELLMFKETLRKGGRP